MAQPRRPSRDHPKRYDRAGTTDDSPPVLHDDDVTPTRTPSILRAAPGRLAEMDPDARDDEDSTEATDSSSSSDIAPDQIRRPRNANMKGSAVLAAAKGDKPMSAALQEEVATLREAVMLNQHRTRSTGSAMPSFAGLKPVSPIKEEVSPDAPSLDATVRATDVKPTRTTSSISNTSTESQRTVRGGSAAATPMFPGGEGAPLRTPSYPFPYVPGSPRMWPGYHQPFTTLSPTTTYRNTPTSTGPVAPLTRTITTPSATTPGSTLLFPTNQPSQPPEDPRFPSPNLYDLILDLNAEPGIERWWTAVSNLLHDHFAVDRATAVVPMDVTDIENVPWALKATFDVTGRNAIHSAAFREDSYRPSADDHAALTKPQKLHAERFRPRLESRHSYAGHGRDDRDVSSTLSAQPTRPLARPYGPRRTVTYQPGMDATTESSRMLPSRTSSNWSVNHPSLSDTDFSSMPGDVEDGPYAEVFSHPATLDREEQPLIEASGVHRVLRKGKLVTVIRDYVSTGDHSESFSTTKKFAENVNYAGTERTQKPRGYDEYEQQDESPWAQSPGPSPAIQADEDRNPFFASDDEQVQNSFNTPIASPETYTGLAPAAAVGVDCASCIMHLPLIHPTLSQVMPHVGKTPSASRTNSGLDAPNIHTRKVPIAIISVLCPVVPYPANLVHALKLLGPHLATSYSTALQFSSAQPEAVSIRRRRTASGNPVSTAPMGIVPASLADLLEAELELPTSSSNEAVTSPSDYSGRSRHSPGSVLGTPGWDGLVGTWSSNRSLTGTPAVASTHELVDNYFEAKKRSGARSASNASSTNHPVSIKSARSSTSNEKLSKSGTSNDTPSRHNSRKTKFPQQSHSKDELNVGQTIARENSPSPRPNLSHRSSMAIAMSQPADLTSPRAHSLLHSYGADFQASFGFPATGAPMEAKTGVEHNRKSSYPEDMPPPSERLLRTIIDAVPVQIFTAQPETGHLTWVNSKFLIYRGQEPRQVLADPWQAIHPSDRDAFSDSWHRSLRTNQQMQQKVRLQRFDGSYRWFYVRAAPLKDKNLRIVHWIGTMMDFHEQHVAEQNSARQQETAASEAKYRAVANSSPQIVFAVSPTAGITFCNSQWTHYSGQPEARALGVGFMDHVHPDDLVKCQLPKFDGDSNQATNVPTSLPAEPRRSVSSSANSSSGSSDAGKTVTSGETAHSSVANLPQRKLSELAKTGILKVTRDADGRPSYSTEVRLKSKDGVYRWHLVRVLRAESILQSEDEGGTWYGTCTDINDHKTLERDLKENMDEKSRFLSNMSHEIRTPLNGITGMVNFLIDSNLSAEQMEHVNIIRTSTEGLRGLINDILDLSKAEAGMIQLSMDWLYIRALIEEINDLTSTMAIDKGLELNYIVEPDVPAQFKGDRFRIRQILLNVVGNAIKFTQKGEVFIRCSVRTDEAGELATNEKFIQFEVIDTGRGFTDKEAEFLFKRFSQIDGSSTRQHGGSGLGLVISRQLAQLHGGDMSARGVPEQGSNFTFFIKTAVPSLKDQPPPAVTPGPTTITILPGAAAMTPIESTSETRAEAAARLLGQDLTESPMPFVPPGGAPRASPSSASPASSGPSVISADRNSSVRSERSSASSIGTEALPTGAPINLAMPADVKGGHPRGSQSSTSSEANPTASLRPGMFSTLTRKTTPPMFSILVIAPLKYSREATVQHINKILPRNVPHQITARESLVACQQLLGGDEPVFFTHVVVVLKDVDEIIALMRQVFSPPNSTTTLVVITDLAQRRKIIEQAGDTYHEGLASNGRLLFIFKPLKPSRLGLIFDPQKERESSTDRNQDSAQQVAVNQKQVFDELFRRLGHKSQRVLLVEDNRINQMVVLKYLRKVSIEADTALDGVQCTDKIFAHPPGYYSIVLCDLHMPNKDGYQTCREIRAWERRNATAAAAAAAALQSSQPQSQQQQPSRRGSAPVTSATAAAATSPSAPPTLPVIALSANVLGDVYQKCVDAGFNSYLTKPVDFKELSTVLMTFMDPSDPSKPHETLKGRRKGGRA